MKLIPNWQEYDLHCFWCGTDKSVKYFVNLEIKGKKRTICTCNKCVLTKGAENERN